MAGGAVNRAPFAWVGGCRRVVVQRVRQSRRGCSIGPPSSPGWLSSGPSCWPEAKGTDTLPSSPLSLLFSPVLSHAPASGKAESRTSTPPTAGDWRRGAGAGLCWSLCKVKHPSGSDLGGQHRSPPPSCSAEVLVGFWRSGSCEGCSARSAATPAV